MFMYTTPTFITEELCLVTQVQLLLMTVIVNKRLIQCWLTLVRLVTMTRSNFNATPTTDSNCSCHIKAVELFNQSYGVHIMPLVINSLGGGYTHTHTHTHTHTNTHTDVRTETTLRNQARA